MKMTRPFELKEALMHHVYYEDDLNRFCQLLDQTYFDVDELLNSAGWRLIHIAVEGEKWHYVHALLDRGARIMYWYIMEDMILYDAPKDILQRCLRYLPDGINMLAETYACSKDQISMLHGSVHHHRVAKDLLDLGADVNQRSKGGWLPLEWALFLNEPRIAILYLQHGSLGPNVDRLLNGREHPFANDLIFTTGEHPSDRVLKYHHQHIQPRITVLALGQLIDVPRLKRLNWISRDLLRMVGDYLY